MLVAEYRYNGLGYRTGVHEDTDTDSDVDGSDLWYYSAYDERWRMVATYRSSDSNPKERFVHQQAGDDGYGGGSYIDLVAFREKDANTDWTSTSDGTLEERLYYCQNQHADVVALITAAGGQREMVRYSAYGVPFGLPVGDCDSDGDAETDDANQIRAWFLSSPAVYDVRGDLDLDGDLDSTDRNLLLNNYNNVTLGRGLLSASAVGNRRGMAGYELNPRLYVTQYHVRNRTLWSDCGLWMRRDPLGYVDVVSIYRYVRSNPALNNDFLGLEDENGFVYLFNTAVAAYEKAKEKAGQAIEVASDVIEALKKKNKNKLGLTAATPTGKSPYPWDPNRTWDELRAGDALEFRGPFKASFVIQGLADTTLEVGTGPDGRGVSIFSPPVGLGCFFVEVAQEGRGDAGWFGKYNEASDHEHHDGRVGLGFRGGF